MHPKLHFRIRKGIFIGDFSTKGGGEAISFCVGVLLDLDASDACQK